MDSVLPIGTTPLQPWFQLHAMDSLLRQGCKQSRICCFNSMQWILDFKHRHYPPPLAPKFQLHAMDSCPPGQPQARSSSKPVSTPCNGFIVKESKLTPYDLIVINSFNSMQWIPVVHEVIHHVFYKLPGFNSMQWIRGDKARRSRGGARSFNSMQWIPAVSSCIVVEHNGVSTPCNGFPRRCRLASA